MKAAVQAAASLAALAGLLGGVAAHATDIAELPLKASVLAAPNVVFGMDDSGSMDWEVLLNTSSGLVYWDGNSSWNSDGTAPLKSDGTYDPLGYLFPVGTGTGGQIYSQSSSSQYGNSAPPIPQFAWLRSAAYNPLYYNPTVTYKPWSPAYVNGAKQTYPDATPTAAKSHPASSSSPTLDLTADFKSGSTNWNTSGWKFRVYKNMRLPKDTRVNATSDTSEACKGSTARTLSTTVTATNSCFAAVPYYPATYWMKEDCAVDDISCTLAPDGQKLKRYEIRPANYATPAAYDAAMKNFANWFTYHRKRKLMLAASMGSVLENITGLGLGVVPFNDRGTITMYSADATSASNNRFAAAGKFYLNAMAQNGTPTLATMKHIGDQYDTDSNLIKYACQRNAMFIVTDGFANDNGVEPPAYTASTWNSDVAPYQTTPTKTQSDIALSYYTNRLRASDLAAGKVPASASTASNADKNTNLHVNTYAITLGVRGALWPNTVDPFVTAPSWSAPSADDPSMVDDLWHATINGRGKMYLATDTTNTASAIAAGLFDIQSQTGAQSGVAVSSVNLLRGNGFAYMGTYNPSGWVGDLTANAISADTAAISSSATWSASAKLLARDWTTRQIVSQTAAGGGVVFDAAGVGATVNPGGTYGSTADVIDYLRGRRALEGGTFRTRTSLMGAVISAEPVIDADNEVVYIASGEGMLHAIDMRVASSTVGQELWAFVPYAVLGDIGKTTERSYVFKTQLDGTPALATTDSGKLLVSGMGAAGNAYFALDVTSTRTLGESGTSWVKWQFPGGSTASYANKVGQTLGKPSIVKTKDGWRVLVTSGYNSTLDGKGRLFVLDPANGAVLKEFVTDDGSTSVEAGLAHVGAFVDPSTGIARYAYGGDLLGNVWRFDLDAASGAAPLRMAQLRDGSNNAQPVTSMPLLTSIGGQRVVLVGTGRLLGIGDFGNTNVQSFYALADTGVAQSSLRSTLAKVSYDRSNDTISITGTIDWPNGVGWYLDLAAGEQQNTRAALAYGGVAFTTNKAGATDCSASSFLYVLDIESGKEIESAGYASVPLSSSTNVSAVTAVVTSDGVARGLTQDSEGKAGVRTLGTGKPIKPAKNSWREVRQE